MKRLLTLLLTITILLCLCSCSAAPGRTDSTDTVETVTASSEIPTEDLTSAHGYFSPKDHAEIVFRGQRYYNTLANGMLILDNPMSGVAYITSEDITDDQQAAEEGAMIRYNADQPIPDILMMKTEDYFKDNNYNPDLYYEYIYFCKKEEHSVFGQKLRTRAFNNLYVTYFEIGSNPGEFTLGKHDLLDEDTTAAIKRTAELNSNDYLNMTALSDESFKVFTASVCDKNMLLDPGTNHYTIIQVGEEFYIGDLVGVHFYHAAEEDKAVIAAMMTKYASTVDVISEYYKKVLSYAANQDSASA